MSDRQKIVNTAVSYIGCKESDGSHKKIIDIYNAHKPLARGYAVKYTDAWCATFVSAMAIKCDLTDIIPTECGCEKMINLFKKLGAWQESDAHVPKPGDVIFYDWDDSGKGDDTGRSDHVGIVEKVSGSTITVIEGNKSNAVGRRTLQVNGRYIRGYGVPKYKETESTPAKALEFNVGDVVEFTGSKHYSNANAATGRSCKPGKATVTGLYRSGKHPYHLKRVSGAGSTVYGWVDEADVKEYSKAPEAPAAPVKVDTAMNKDGALKGTYKTTAALNMRTGAGTGKKIMLTIPKGKSVKCYGYYNKDSSGTKWLYVVYAGKTGYCSSKYLTKG